ncbi:phosphatase PAP2 family protein [Streptomyces sp. NBC_00285]|uniref:phosphatase PAP2 family protein n=1 Tax=Streptomyces sp. NBC_00285 TaxID=2975700 RepID=UPI002E289017|nr:phosphatase PAP2 family protein [Streptomyces sp. NBC_00285]
MKRGDITELAGSCGLGAWTALGVLTMGVVGHDGIPLFADGDLLSWSVGHRPEVAVAFARGLTATGTGVIPFALAALAGVVIGRTLRQRTLAAVLCMTCLGAGQALRYAVMASVTRPRPPRADWDTHASGWAFPSGHSTTAAVTAGLLIIAVCVRGPRGRIPLILIIGGWGASVGLTRVYLGVHWFTDVVGGWLFALGWLGVCMYAVARRLPERWTPRTSDPDTSPGTTEATGTTDRRTDPDTSLGTTKATGTTDRRTDPAREQGKHGAPEDSRHRGRSRPA